MNSEPPMIPGLLLVRTPSSTLYVMYDGMNNCLCGKSGVCSDAISHNVLAHSHVVMPF